MLLSVISGCSLRQTLRPQTYTVHRGDTVYSIAREYGINWHRLARWNHISPPYRIDIGQRLTLDPYPPLDYNHMSGARAGTSAPRSASSEQATPQLKRTIEMPGADEPPGTKDSVPAGTAKRGSSSKQMRRRDKQVERHIARASKQGHDMPVPDSGPTRNGWQWPASGSILRRYDADDSFKGIEIGGEAGQPVYSASSGRVVYNGTGLKGYGRLIIVKHDAHYLSAYGFNRKSLVKQGEKVPAGAHIADMGLGPENKPMLRFEVRHDGQPIDPNTVLPAH